MRTIGAAILGLFLGLLAGILLTDVAGRMVVAGGSSIGASLVVGLMTPAASLVGAVAGIVVEQRVQNGRRRR
ncbi:MAG: hypothetical protein ACREQM_08195 [Candidatus Dormibacteraceae bacterium]